MVVSNYNDKGLEHLIVTCKRELLDAKTINDLNQIKSKYLGKKSNIHESLRDLSSVSPQQRPVMGKKINEIKQTLTSVIKSAYGLMEENKHKEEISKHKIDVSLPSQRPFYGGIHPITRIIRQLQAVFISMGFEIKEGPDIETQFNNFGALNVPDDHVSRSIKDTFYFDDGTLLRTHTSPIQIRTMLEQEPPIQIISCGHAFRPDTPDATHTPMFHQIEGLVVGKDCHFGHMKSLIMTVLRWLMGDKIKFRFRPAYFPFTEPSAEVDIFLHGGWMEILGCGMVHPNVLKNVNIDAEIWTGFAFGIGIERLAMVLYGLDDIRHLYAGDLDFLQQFN